MTASRAGSRPGRAPGWGKPCSTETLAPHPPGPAPPQSSHAGAAAENPRRIRSQAPWPGHLQRRIRNPKGEPPCAAAFPRQWPPSGLELFTSSCWTGLRGRARSCSTGQTHLWVPPTPEVPSVPDCVATTRESHIRTYPRSRGALPACLPHPPGLWWSGRLPPPPPLWLPLASWPQTSPQGLGPWALQSSSPAPGISSALSSFSFWGVQQLLRLEFCQLKQETRKGCHFNPVTQ